MHIDLIGVGSPIVDILSVVDESFIKSISGEKGGMVLVNEAEMHGLLSKIPQDSQHTSPGGSAGNTTFAAARLGVSTSFLGKIGNDAAADFFRSELIAAGGDDSRLKKGKQDNGQCLSLVTPDSQRTMRTNLGAAMTLSPDEVCVDDFMGCTIAHIEGYLLFNPILIQQVLACAKTAGCKISLDLASFEVVGASKEALPYMLQEYIDIVFANEDEATALLGGDDYEAMALKLNKWCDIAVVKLGKEGSLVAHKGKLTRHKAFVVDKAIDTTGAGDFYAAGFLSAHLKNHTIAEAATLGAKLGAAVVQTMGTQLSEETWAELRATI